MIDQKKEIDLIYVIKKLFDKVKKNVVLFVSIILIFVVIGVVYNTTKKEYFTYSSIAKTSLDKEVFSKFIDDLNIINSKENNIIPKLVRIDVNYNNEESGNKFFNIDLLLNDTTNIEETIYQIKNFLISNGYIKNAFETKKKIILNKIQNYNNEIKKINKIQNLVFESNNSETTIISTNGLSKEKIDFQQEVIDLQKELDSIDVLAIVNSKLYIFKSSKNLIQTSVIFLFLGLFFGLFVILLKK